MTSWYSGREVSCCCYRQSKAFRMYIFLNRGYQHALQQIWSNPVFQASLKPLTWNVTLILIISDPRRGCFMGFLEFIFFFSFLFFSRHDLVRAISLELSLVETPNSVCCFVLWSNFALLLTIQFASLLFLFLFYFFFSATILSGLYLWNRYPQRLQIECAAWSCGLILHCCLPSNSLRYLFIFFFFSPPRFCPGNISGTVTRRDSKLSVLLGPAV